ncbi:hypothetical protein CYMTET_29175 [Cymbomonas tetramitiformis]|uniref:Uncharacterized protein n=1 Tax=Cymbomonas tetramitiformis TaxID=36881 RepID=A0AAE0KVG5_9CHLO|nr:hypothetical protein CYMTET_29175 [Cymbomonas tetramitiformis]
MLELRGQLEYEPGSSQRGGLMHCQWLNDFDKNRSKAMLSFTSKSVANSDARVMKDHRDRDLRLKERKKRDDDDKDGKKPTGKGGKGRGGKPAANG